jgi:ParB family chromosome partitioning protein
MSNKIIEKKSKLGMGLSSLFIDKMSLVSDSDHHLNDNSETNQNQGLLYLDISSVKPCPTQPRKIFDQSALSELSESIKEYGVMQPIIVKQKNEQGFYEIIAGERRWKASILAGQKKIPAVIKNLDGHNAFLLSIIENLQRADLSPIEEADVYQRLVDDGYTHDQIGFMLSKSRSYISNIIRLTNLTQYVKDLVNKKFLSLGHAKLLLCVKNQDELADLIVERNLNIRETEDLIREIDDEKKSNKINIYNDVDDIKGDSYKNDKLHSSKNRSSDFKELANMLSKKFNVKAVVSNGKIVLSYDSLSDLDRLIAMLMN